MCHDTGTYTRLTRPKDDVDEKNGNWELDIEAQSQEDTFECKMISHQEKVLHRT